MAQPQSRSRSANRPKRHQPPSQTKFDIWLESHLSSGQSIQFLFRIHPLSGMNLFSTEAKVITVDRYHVFLDFGEAQVWVAKDNIISAE